MKQNVSAARPYNAPLTHCLNVFIETKFCASNYGATNENYEDYETEYTLE